MKQDNIDLKILLYTAIQFSHTKAHRDKYRLKNPHIQILCSLYYIEHYFKPPRGGVKTRLVLLNPQWNYERLNKYLDRLETAGLIAYKSGNNLQTYTIVITKEGEQLIKELYSIPVIGELIDKY